MNAIPDNASDLLDVFHSLGDWEERYSYIIELGENLPQMPENEKNDLTRVFGCQSQVWMKPIIEGRYFDFVADSDSKIVKGLIGLLREVYSGQTTDFVQTFDIERFFSALELRKHLSTRRGNGLREMIKRIKFFAANADRISSELTREELESSLQSLNAAQSF